MKFPSNDFTELNTIDGGDMLLVGHDGLAKMGQVNKLPFLPVSDVVNATGQNTDKAVGQKLFTDFYNALDNVISGIQESLRSLNTLLGDVALVSKISFSNTASVVIVDSQHNLDINSALVQVFVVSSGHYEILTPSSVVKSGTTITVTLGGTYFGYILLLGSARVSTDIGVPIPDNPLEQ